MATTTQKRDYMGRKLVTPGSNSLDFTGRATTSTADYTGRALIGATRANTTAYVVGDLKEWSTGVLMQCTVAGTSAASEPAAPGHGNTVVDGTVTWRQITTA